MHIFGLTGNIACGKSTVSRVFAKHGIPIIDADVIARGVVARGTAGLDEVVAAFGKRILLPNGELDRKGLAKIVFTSKDARILLNSITHPRIAERTKQMIGELHMSGVKLACYDAALIVENNMQDTFRPLVVVTAPPALQLRWAMGRDLVSEHEVRARIDAQMPQDQKAAAADIVLVNDSDIVTLELNALEVLKEVKRHFSVP